jgi:CelD/BcsL family acetyltransferase involved in cellulose biosynthesis
MSGAEPGVGFGTDLGAEPCVGLDVDRAAAPGVGLRVHRSPETLAPLEEGWRDLVAATPGSSYFTTPDWVLASWEALTADSRNTAEVATWTGRDGRVEAVIPLVRSKDRLHPRIPVPVACWTLLGAGRDAADHGLLLATPQRREEVRVWLRERVGGSSLWLPALDPESDTGLLPPGTRRIGRTTCPRLSVSPAVPVGSVGFRRHVRRRERQLARCGISFRWVGPPDMTADLLDAVLRLHRQRQDHKGAVTAFGPDRRGFHLRLQARAETGRGPAALVAERDGIPVGAVYGFLWQNVFAYYNGGWDPAYARLSLGTVLMHRVIDTVTEAEVRTFDFLRGDEAYKYRPFCAQERYDEQWLRARSIPALLAGQVLRHGRRPQRHPTPHEAEETAQGGPS